MQLFQKGGIKAERNAVADAITDALNSGLVYADEVWFNSKQPLQITVVHVQY